MRSVIQTRSDPDEAQSFGTGGGSKASLSASLSDDREVNFVRGQAFWASQVAKLREALVIDVVISGSLQLQ